MPLELSATTLDRGRSEPLYMQLAAHIRDRIQAGDLRPGEALPAVGELGKLAGVSGAVVRPALLHLTRQNLITTRPGRVPRVVEDSSPAAAFLSGAMTDHVLDQLSQRIARLPTNELGREHEVAMKVAYANVLSEIARTRDSLERDGSN